MSIFLDHASMTPLDRRVFRAMKPFLCKNRVNPSALYDDGVKTKKALELARTNVARMLLCQEREVIFTASGTESDNLALLGVFESAKRSGVKNPHIITTAVEHSAVLEACHEIERRGGRVSVVNPNENGIISAESIMREISTETVLISVMLVNNEIGVIEPVRDIVRQVKNYRSKQKSVYPYVHTDASQAPCFLPIDLPRLDVDMMTLDGIKIYGPSGVGVLIKKYSVPIAPILYGGGQEFGLRSGTENVSAIVGFAEALRIAIADREKESKRLTALRDFMIKEICSRCSGAKLNGDNIQRVPNNINICFPGIDAEFLVISLSKYGICVSPGSSCRNISEDNSSYVLEAINKKECSRSSVRFTLGRSTRKRHIVKTLKILDYVYNQMI